jgi:hypothetical protein
MAKLIPVKEAKCEHCENPVGIDGWALIELVHEKKPYGIVLFCHACSCELYKDRTESLGFYMHHIEIPDEEVVAIDPTRKRGEDG